MKKLLIPLLLIFTGHAMAAVPVTPAPVASQAAMLESDSPQLAANKRLVYDFWRTILRGYQLDQTANFMAEDYIQHNPNAETGMEGFLAYFRAVGIAPQPVKDSIDGLVAIMAEGDLVTLAFVRELDNPRAPGETYTTTWFDMFRVENGKITEHWDIATIAPPQ